VLEELKKALSRDRTRMTVNGFTQLGLVEMTRKRTRESLAHVLCESCPTCGGRGEVKTARTVCYEILREILREARAFKALEEELRKDRARTNVLKISELGLVEMTRKRTQDDLVRSISEPCLYCEGRGYTRSRLTVVYDILREIRREAVRGGGRATIYVNANPLVADLMYGDEMESTEQMEERLGKRIVVRAMGHYHLERYEVYSR